MPLQRLYHLATTASSLIDAPLNKDDIECPPLVERRKGGHPKGSTTVAACKQFKEEKAQAKHETSKCTKAVYDSIIKSVKQEYELGAGALNIHTINSRVQRNNVLGKNKATTSLLLELERHGPAPSDLSCDISLSVTRLFTELWLKHLKAGTL
jgi:hypothetical protein